MPLVSIVMSVYNDGHYVKEAIDSILSQTFADFEFLIVDDGCTDNTREIIGSYKDARIRVVINERNIGLAPSLNKAIRLSNAKYVARQDADDVSLPDRLSREVEYLETHPDVALVGSTAIVISHDGEPIGPLHLPCDEIDLQWDLLFRNPFVHSSVMMRRSIVERVGYYTGKPEIAKAFVEDYDLWSRINKISRLANIPTPLLNFRQNPTSASARTRNDQLEQAAGISLRNMGCLLDRETSPQERAAFDDLNLLFRSPSGYDPQLPPARLRGAIAFLDELQKKFYAQRRFSRSQIARHRRRWSWFWGKHLLALSVRSRAGIANRLTLAALGSRYMQRMASPTASAT